MSELPVVQGLLICEQVVIDARTRNISFTNRFTAFRVDQFPSPPRQFAVFASLTNGFGEHELRLELEDLQTGDVMVRDVHSVLFPDRLADAPVIFKINEVVFPHEGSYQLSLFVSGEPLSRLRFNILTRSR
jgi:hypothetical protein